MPSNISSNRTIPADEWSHLSNKVREQWSDVTAEDIEQTKGNAEELISAVQQKTGETREIVERFIREGLDQASTQFNQLRESTSHYSEEAVEAMREGYDRASAQIRESYSEAQRYVRRKPTESLAIAFGAGILTGLALVAMRSFRR